MQKKELINSSQKLGKQITEVQIKNWVREGLIPAPKRENDGKVGSNYIYSEIAKNNLELILSSNEYNKNLKRLVIDVWFRGGSIESSKLIAILDWELEKIEKPIRKVVKFISEAEKIFKSSSHSKVKKNLPFPKKSLDNNLTALNVMVNALSPNGNPDLWKTHIYEDVEISADQIAAEVTGFTNLFEYSNESLWDEVYQNLKITKLRKSLKKLKDEDLESLNIYVVSTVDFINNLKEIIFLGNKRFSSLTLLFNINSKHKMICYLLVIIIHLYKSSTGRIVLEDFIKEIQSKKNYLDSLVSYVKHMRQHPYLKKKKIWNLQGIDEEILDSLKNHQQIYLDGNINFEEELRNELNPVATS